MAAAINASMKLAATSLLPMLISLLPDFILSDSYKYASHVPVFIILDIKVVSVYSFVLLSQSLNLVITTNSPWTSTPILNPSYTSV